MRFTLPILAAALLTASAAAAAGTRSEIRRIDWHAVDVNGIPVTGDRPLTLRLGADKVASGHGGCNSFTAGYRRRSDLRLEFGPIASTKMACAGAVGEQEARDFAILDAAETYSRYGDGSLSVIAPDGRAVRYRRR